MKSTVARRTRRQFLQSPIPFPNLVSMESSHETNGDRADNCIEENGPDSSNKALVADVRRFVMTYLDDQKPDLSTCDHCRSQERSCKPCSLPLSLSFSIGLCLFACCTFGAVFAVRLAPGSCLPYRDPRSNNTLRQVSIFFSQQKELSVMFLYLCEYHEEGVNHASPNTLTRP